MREILFRGKHIHVLPKNEHLDGRWIYGYLQDQNYINSPELEGEFLVDPETVCQYTGLTDKNGRKIFEGDILSGKRYCDYGQSGEYKEDECVIKWNEEHAAFDPFYWWNGYNHSINNYKIIGNIFDNPELLTDKS